MEPGNAQLSMTVLMTPDMANFSGNVHGGTLLKYLDEVAYACAARYAGRYVVTLSVDQVIFREPVHVGELVTFLASVNYTGNTSMEVGIKVGPRTSASARCATATAASSPRLRWTTTASRSAYRRWNRRPRMPGAASSRPSNAASCARNWKNAIRKSRKKPCRTGLSSIQGQHYCIRDRWSLLVC